jgi:hypothetical protein
MAAPCTQLPVTRGRGPLSAGFPLRYYLLLPRKIAFSS